MLDGSFDPHSKIIPVLTMSPFTGVNHALLGAARALSSIDPIETKPALSDDLVREFKQVIGGHRHTIAEIQPLLAETEEILKGKFPCLSDPEPDAVYVVMNPGNGPKRVLQSLTFKYMLPNAMLVGFNYPDYAEHLFDLTVINPSQPWRTNYATPLLSVDAVPNHISEAKLAEARGIWQPELRSPGRRLVAVLVGGDIGKKGKQNYFPFTLDHARELVRYVRLIAASADVDIAITTSRRTPKDAVELLQTELAMPGPDGETLAKFAYFPCRGAGPNPYMGFLASADALIVTPDSMSMMSEGVDAGIPVYTVPLRGLLRREHECLYEFLIGNGYVTELPAPISFGPGKPIRAAQVVAEAIRTQVARSRWRIGV